MQVSFVVECVEEATKIHKSFYPLSTMQTKVNLINLILLLTVLEFRNAETSSGDNQKSPSESSSGHVYSSFQHGIICNTSFPLEHPKSLADIQAIVHHALFNNLTVKALGNLHSVSDLICTDGMPVSMQYINHFNYHPETGRCTVGAGLTLHYLTERLHTVGRALEGMPAYGDITVGGAIATGAHGSSLKYQTTLSDQLVSLTIVDGLGNVRNISEGGILNAFRTHLGLLGLIYSVTFKTTPQYMVQVANYPLSDKILGNPLKIIEMAKSSSYFHFWWFPSAEQVVLSRGQRVATHVGRKCETHMIPETSVVEINRGYKIALEQMQQDKNDFGLFLFQLMSLVSLYWPVAGKTPIYTLEASTSGGVGINCPQPATGYSHRMLSNICDKCPWNYEGRAGESFIPEETEVIIPLSELPQAIQTMKEILKESPAEFYMNGIFFRFITPSESLLAGNWGKESVGIEWVLEARDDRFEKPKLGLATLQALAQALIEKHKGRTHWGKGGLYYTTPNMLQKRHGQQNNLKTFVTFMEQLDPYGIFLNDFGRRLRFGEEKMTLLPYMLEHCALLDHCVCKNDFDCGKGGTLDYKCGILHGYRVCMDNPTDFERDRRRVERRLFRTYSRMLLNTV